MFMLFYCGLSPLQKTPGPGAYEPTFQSPLMPETIKNMGRRHGVFFTSAFKV